MEMKAGLFQEQSLRLNMTQQMMQAISLLQYSSLELAQYLQELSLENPLIEIKEQDVPSELYHKGQKPKNKSTSDGIENIGSEKPGLAEYLRLQLLSHSLSGAEKKLTEFLIDSLNENGYLEETAEELAERTGADLEEVRRALHLLHSLEPAGIAAGSLQECLLLQLYRLPERKMKLEEVIEKYFLLFAEKSWKQLSKSAGIPLTELQEMHDFIRKLNPRPGLAFRKEREPYLVPDLLLEKKDGEFIISYNNGTHPELGLSMEYSQFLLEREHSEAGHFLKGKWKQYRWLQKALSQRKSTMIRVMAAIIEQQAEFFHTGRPELLRPMTLRDIADACGIHESTVSRAVKDKYVQLPTGLCEIRSFFSQGVEQEGDQSSSSIKMRLAELVKREDKQAPLSDQKMAELLKEKEQIAISRRTVAKYREQLSIPSSALRKRYDGRSGA